MNNRRAEMSGYFSERDRQAYLRGYVQGRATGTYSPWTHLAHSPASQRGLIDSLRNFSFWGDSQPAASTQPESPGIFETAGNALNTFSNSAASLASSVSTATSIAVYGVVGIGLYMLWKESQTDSGRSRVAHSAGRAAEGAAKTAATLPGVAAKAFI